MTDITPFAIDVASSDIDDLKARLALTRFPDRETPEDWSQGIPLAYMQEIKAYWQNQYDWPARQALLNRWDGFKTDLDGLSIHFLHIRSSHADAKPLLLTHGWPGSIVEFQKVIGPLTEPTEHGGDSADAFHLVVPSLPGFGFSGKPTAPGWGIDKIAQAWAQPPPPPPPPPPPHPNNNNNNHNTNSQYYAAD
ncbi:MAG: epoxide hydrolase family protein, partial [Pseudomonadales bacterium]